MKKKLILFFLLLSTLNTVRLNCAKLPGLKKITQIEFELEKEVLVYAKHSIFFKATLMYIKLLEAAIGENIQNLSFSPEAKILTLAQNIDQKELKSALKACKWLISKDSQYDALLTLLKNKYPYNLLKEETQDKIILALTKEIARFYNSKSFDLPEKEKVNTIKFVITTQTKDDIDIELPASDESFDAVYMYLTLLNKYASICNNVKKLIFNTEQKILSCILPKISEKDLILVIQKCEFLLKNKHILPELEKSLQKYATQKRDNKSLILNLTKDIIKFAPPRPQEEKKGFFSNFLNCGGRDFPTMDFSDQELNANDLNQKDDVY